MIPEGNKEQTKPGILWRRENLYPQSDSFGSLFFLLPKDTFRVWIE